MMPTPATWTDAERMLWQRIADHPLDDPEQPLDFTARLAREQGLSRSEAVALIEEYRRFCFLAVVAGIEVTPSAEVDEVWHLHLCYSRDYWQRFCPNVLGVSLHHGPTAGRSVDGRRYRAQYADTLAAYAAYFGPPPERYWPDAQSRFARPERFRRVDLSRVWLLPRPCLHLSALDWRVLSFAALALLIPASAAALTGDPLDWTGTAFLKLYFALLVAVVLISQIQRRILRAGPGAPPPSLSVWETAMLAGGPARVADAAVAELHRRGWVYWDESSRSLRTRPADSDLEKPLDEVYSNITRYAASEAPGTLGQRQFDALGTSLERRDLWLDAEHRARIARLTAWPVLALFVFGCLKIGIGVYRDRPVGFLVMLSIVTLIYGLIMRFSPPQRSQAGDRYLALARIRWRHALRTPRDQDMTIAVALAGTSVLAGGALAAYHQARMPSTSSGDSAGGSDSSNGGSDGGGSGCGGCGGGD